MPRYRRCLTFASCSGDGDIGQINKIFQTLGTPDETTWPTIHELPDWNKVHFGKAEGVFKTNLPSCKLYCGGFCPGKLTLGKCLSEIS